MAFHNTLTPFLADAATAYEPEHETSTEFMNGKFQELLENDLDLLNKINVLSGGSATLSITDFTQIDNLTTTGIYNFYVSTAFTKDGVSFTAGGLYTIDVKRIAYNNSVVGITQLITCNYPNANEKYIYYRMYYAIGGWGTLQRIVNTTQWQATSSNLVNGWQAWGGIYLPTFTRNGNLVTVTNGSIGSGAITAGTILITGIPTEYIPSGLRTAVLKHATGASAMAIVDVDGTIKADTSWGGSWLSTGLYDMNFSYHLV